MGMLDELKTEESAPLATSALGAYLDVELAVDFDQGEQSSSR